MYAQDISASFGQSLKLWRIRHLPLVVGLVSRSLTDKEHQQGKMAANEGQVFDGLARHEYLMMLEANAVGATNFGAQAILTRPSELYNQVTQRYLSLKGQRRI